jgi:hypothetical protein
MDYVVESVFLYCDDDDKDFLSLLKLKCKCNASSSYIPQILEQYLWKRRHVFRVGDPDDFYFGDMSSPLKVWGIKFSQYTSIRDDVLGNIMNDVRCVRMVDMAQGKKITDAGLVHLKGVHTIDPWGCEQITNAGLASLKGALIF